MSEREDQPVLEVRGAVKRFGAIAALNGVSLSLYNGEVLALLGDNGAGKTTLVNAINGNLRLDDGHISLDGEPVAFRSAAEARAHGIETVYQKLALFDNMSAADNFYAGREASRWPRLGALAPVRDAHMTREARKVLDELEVRLPASAMGLVGLMSGGQRQAIAVARAAAFASKIIILDEPTAALGVRESRNVLRLVKRLAERGVSVILISHNLEDVMAAADRAVVLDKA